MKGDLRYTLGPTVEVYFTHDGCDVHGAILGVIFCLVLSPHVQGQYIERLREIVAMRGVRLDPSYTAELARTADWYQAPLGQLHSGHTGVRALRAH